MPVRNNTYSTRRTAERALDALIHIEPTPRKLYELSLAVDFEHLAERFYWIDRTRIGRLISQGRANATGEPAPTARRTLTLQQQREVVAAVHELGGISYAARAYGLGEALVRTLVREAGPTYPRASRRAADRAAANARIEAFRARRFA
jgi:hypothetical protein